MGGNGNSLVPGCANPEEPPVPTPPTPPNVDRSECVAGQKACADKVDTNVEDKEQTFDSCDAVEAANLIVNGPKWAICQYLRPCGCLTSNCTNADGTNELNNVTHAPMDPYHDVPGCVTPLA